MKSLGVDSCRVIPWARHSGARNMALDVVAARRATEEGLATIRTYGWDPSTLSLGYAQGEETIDWLACRDAGIHITRRPTGGGAILHEGWGDVAYSIVLPADGLPSDLMRAYRTLCEPVLDAFARLGINVEFAADERPALYHPACYLREVHPAHDLVVVDAGIQKKVSGNAQYRQRDAVVQHGSLRVDYDPARLLDCFVEPGVTVDDVRERILSTAELGVDELMTVSRALESALIDVFQPAFSEWSSGEMSEADTLIREKFGNNRWIRNREDPLAAAD